MRPDVAPSLNGVEQTLAGILVALMNVSVLAKTRAMLCLLSQTVEVLSVKNFHDLFSASSHEGSDNLANRSINSKLSLKKTATTVQQIISLCVNLGQQLVGQLQQFTNVICLADLPHLFITDHLSQIVTRIHVGKNRQATLHVRQELTGDVVRFVPRVQRDDARTALGIKVRDFVRVDCIMEQDVVQSSVFG